jgi:hypothetical protein
MIVGKLTDEPIGFTDDKTVLTVFYLLRATDLTKESGSSSNLFTRQSWRFIFEPAIAKALRFSLIEQENQVKIDPTYMSPLLQKVIIGLIGKILIYELSTTVVYRLEFARGKNYMGGDPMGHEFITFGIIQPMSLPQIAGRSVQF